MYNVFVNNKLLTIAKNAKNDHDVKFEFKDSEQLSNLISDLEEGRLESVIVVHKKPFKVFKKLMKLMETRIAAGGLVRNEKGRILFIFRKGQWDLPKGHLDKGETLEECAVREVEEETGVKSLEIVKYLGQTYHIFRTKKKQILKISNWFEMYSEFDGKLIPQEDEDITKVKWIKKKELDNVLSNSWSNIKLLFTS